MRTDDAMKLLLQELYIKQKLSSSAIAKQLSCDPATVRNRLRALGLPVRTQREAYQYRIFTRFPGRIIYPKRNFDGDTAHKAYLIGFRLGDLTATVCSGPYSKTIEVKGRTTRSEQIRLFRNLFSGYGHLAQRQPDRHGAVHLTCYLNRSFDFLLPKQDGVEPWIGRDPRCAAAFVAGYIDAEGSFHISTKKTGLKKAVFALASQDREILNWCYRWFQSIGVECPRPKISLHRGTKRMFKLNKDYWILQVRRKHSLIRLIAALTPWIRHGKRKTDMARVVQNINKRNTHPNIKFASRTHRLTIST